METRTKTLLDLDSQTLFDEVAKQANLDAGSVINVSLANRYTYQLFKPTLLQHLKKYAERSAKKQVEGLLNIHLNFDSAHLRDICLTVLKLGDIDILKVITKGREHVLTQIRIPVNLVDITNMYDFTAVVAAIDSDQNVDSVLEKMRTELDNIVKEKGFPFQAMLDAYEIYDKQFNPWTREQCELFTVNVIGYLQRLSPAWLKKGLATGIYNITEAKQACGDTLILKSGESIDVEKDVPNIGIGFDFCVDIFGERNVWLPWGISQYLKDHFEAKTAELGELCSRKSKIEISSLNS